MEAYFFDLFAHDCRPINPFVLSPAWAASALEFEGRWRVGALERFWSPCIAFYFWRTFPISLLSDNDNPTQ
jgi:hypothetical protein